MAYLSLYRKFRPKTFNEVIGQEHIVKILQNQIATNSVSHCYLFSGPRGTGKTSIAKIFSRTINCLIPKDNCLCGECEGCKISENANNLDIYELDAASNNGVDEIRRIKESTTILPVQLRYKVFIIDEVHMLSSNAFNALLKTLEEPPSYCIFILATTERYKLPQTVISRCMELDFRLISLEKLEKKLTEIFAAVNVDAEKQAITLLASLGEGCVRDMLSAAELCMAYSNSKIKYQDVVNVMGLSNPKTIYDLLNLFLKNQTKEGLILLDSLLKDGKTLSGIYKDILNCLSKLIFIKNNNEYSAVPKDLLEYVLKKAENHTNIKLSRALAIMTDCETQLKNSSNSRAYLEAKLLEIGNCETDIDADKLLTRLKVLESEFKNCLEKLNNIEKKDININEDLLNEIRKLISEQNTNILPEITEQDINELLRGTAKEKQYNENEQVYSMTEIEEIDIKGLEDVFATNNAIDSNKVDENNEIDENNDNTSTDSSDIGNLNIKQLDNYKTTELKESYDSLTDESFVTIWRHCVANIKRKNRFLLAAYASDIQNYYIYNNTIGLMCNSIYEANYFNNDDNFNDIYNFFQKHFKFKIKIEFFYDKKKFKCSDIIIKELKVDFGEFAFKSEK